MTIVKGIFQEIANTVQTPVKITNNLVKKEWNTKDVVTLGATKVVESYVESKKDTIKAILDKDSNLGAVAETVLDELLDFLD